MTSLLFPLFVLTGAWAYKWSSKTTEVPQFIIDRAPAVYLYSEERYYPGSPEEFVPLFQMSTRETNASHPLSISNLTSSGELLREELLQNQHDGRKDEYIDLFLTAREQWEPVPGPDWVTKWKQNKPNLVTGEIKGAVSTLIVVDKPELDVIDAFWFYFYPFNLGPFVMGHGPFGNHIGDWEHSLVRFNRTSEVPVSVWMSAHGGGTAYQWESMLQHNLFGTDKSRPVLFSSRGTHAQYTSVGRHSHDIPWHMLSDFTDRGDLWDPSKNFVAYTLDQSSSTIFAANGSVEGREQAWGDWLVFDGHWGNPTLPKNDSRQQWSPFEWRLIDGPTGPMYKNLERRVPCQRSKWWNFWGRCRVRRRITAGEGLDADASGCEDLVQHWPMWVQPFVRRLIRGGYLCFWLDRLFG